MTLEQAREAVRRALHEQGIRVEWVKKAEFNRLVDKLLKQWESEYGAFASDNSVCEPRTWEPD